MRLLHTMIRVGDLQRSIRFYTEALGMGLLRQKDFPGGRFTLAFVGSVISETVASNVGIGYLMLSASSTMDMGLVFAGLVVIGVMGVVMYELFALVERRMTGWATRGSDPAF